MHNLDLPKIGLQLIPSTYKEATPEAVKAGLNFAKLQAEKGSTNQRLFRMVDTTAAGEQSNVQNWVCVASNYTRSHVMDGHAITFVYPGFNRQGTFDLTFGGGEYSYPDPKVNPIPLEWLKFILDPAVSPWRLVLPFVINLDPEYCYENRCIQFHQVDTMPFRVWQSFLIGARYPFEKPGKAKTWWKLVCDGHPKNFAYLMSSSFWSKDDGSVYASPYGGHEAIDNAADQAQGFMTGVYYQGSRCTAYKLNAASAHKYPGYEGMGYSSGFWAPKPAPINIMYAHVREQIKMHSFVNWNVVTQLTRMSYDPEFQYIGRSEELNVRPKITISRKVDAANLDDIDDFEL